MFVEGDHRRDGSWVFVEGSVERWMFVDQVVGALEVCGGSRRGWSWGFLAGAGGGGLLKKVISTG